LDLIVVPLAVGSNPTLAGKVALQTEESETAFAILCATGRYHQFAAWRCVAP